MNTAPIHDRTQEIRLLVSVQQAIRWMGSKRIPLVTGQSHVEAWLDLDADIGWLRHTEEQASNEA